MAPVHGRYPFSRWRGNEIVADRYGPRVPVDAPPGAYSVEAAVGNARPIELGDLTIEKTDRVWTEPPVDHRLEAKLDESVELVGYNIEQTSGSIRLRLIWRALKSIDVDYTVFTHVLDPTGAQIGGQDNQPMQGTYPTSWWAAGEYVVDPYDIKTRAPSQGYTLEVGMYDPETGARLGAALNLTSITR